jgi:hypothetical protein
VIRRLPHSLVVRLGNSPPGATERLRRQLAQRQDDIFILNAEIGRLHAALDREESLKARWRGVALACWARLHQETDAKERG